MVAACRTRRSLRSRVPRPLSPRRKWRAIMLATLCWSPAYWAMLAGLVSLASDGSTQPLAGPYIAFGLALIPFVFLALAFLSEHPRAPAAVVRRWGCRSWSGSRSPPSRRTR